MLFLEKVIIDIFQNITRSDFSRGRGFMGEFSGLRKRSLRGAEKG
jgi:hypothetical protein